VARAARVTFGKQEAETASLEGIPQTDVPGSYLQASGQEQTSENVTVRSTCTTKEGTCQFGQCNCGSLPDIYKLTRLTNGQGQVCWACRSPTLIWDTSKPELLQPCANYNDKAIIQSAEYCFSLNAWVSHCVVVVTLSDLTTAMLELGGEPASGIAAVECHVLPSEALVAQGEANTVLAVSMLRNDGYNPAVYQDYKSSARCIGEYKDQGFLETPCYPMTMAGLRDWTWAYLKNFRDYDPLSTNCQKYATGVYNAVTRSHNSERQRYGAAALSAFGVTAGRSSTSSGDSSGSSIPEALK